MKLKIGLIEVLTPVVLVAALHVSDVFGQTANNEIYKGMCDASAAIALDENCFIVANDEDNDLHIFAKNNSEILQIAKLSDVFKDKIFDGEDLEIDLEGAAQINDKIFWIGSHSASKNGKLRPARNRLFAIHIEPGADGKFSISPIGRIYTTLIADLEKDTRFDSFDLETAKNTMPKAVGGLSIEGLAATPDGALLIGFRNPLGGGTMDGDLLADGKSFVVKLLNPLKVITGKKAKFDAPIELDLGGFGIRSMEYFPDNGVYLIVAGPYHENLDTPEHKPEVSRLYTWSGDSNDAPKLLEKVDLTGFNIEGAFFFPGTEKSIELLSDDGKLPLCTATSKMFRAFPQKF